MNNSEKEQGVHIDNFEKQKKINMVAYEKVKTTYIELDLEIKTRLENILICNKAKK